MKNLLILISFLMLLNVCDNSTEPKDCMGISGGNAYLDNCDVCDGDDSNDCIEDCADTWGGTAFLDQCGYFTGGNTELDPGYADPGCGCEEPAPQLYCADNDGDGLGSGDPQLICPADLTDSFVTDCSDEDDSCAGDIYDCAGVCNGLSVIDDCDVCSLPENFNSSIDDCQVCFGNNEDMDCNNDCFGTAIIDDCGECQPPENYNSSMDDCQICFGDNSDMDCNGDCFGTATIDDCDICSDGETVILHKLPDT